MSAEGKFAKSLTDMVEKSGLDMSYEARMQRATDMGFHNPVLYHGTSTAKSEGDLFGEFQKFEGDDLSRSVSRSPVGKLGISLAEQPEVAKDFAYQASPSDGEGAAMMPLRFRSNKIAQIDLAGDETNDEIYNTVTDAWKQGFDALRFKNYTTPAGTNGSFFLIKNPNQIRSISATFDPEKKESSNLLTGSATIGGIGGTAALTSAPQKSFADSLHDMVMQAPPTTKEIMDAQTKREHYLAQIDQLNQQDNSIQAPQSNMAAAAADFSGKYNNARKEYISPVLDQILPVGELPEDYLRKLSYGDDVTMPDRIKAGLGLL